MVSHNKYVNDKHFWSKVIQAKISSIDLKFLKNLTGLRNWSIFEIELLNNFEVTLHYFKID